MELNLNICEKFRLLDLEYDDPRMNMAVEQSISMSVGKGLSPNTLRFWRNFNVVVIGRNQDAQNEVRRDACMKYGAHIIRRFTGGGSVYQDAGNLNWAISIQKKGWKNHIFDFYKFCGDAIVEGIHNLGLNAQFISPNIIKINEKKVSGMSASLKWNTYFCHGTLLVTTDIAILEEILNVSGVNPQQGYVTSVRVPITTIQKELRVKVELETIKKAIVQGFTRVHGIVFTKNTLSPHEEELAQSFYERKFKFEVL